MLVALHIYVDRDLGVIVAHNYNFSVMITSTRIPMNSARSENMVLQTNVEENFD